MAKRKLAQFAENKTFRHVIEPTAEEVINDRLPLKGNWHRDFFGNQKPIVLELGCGKGEYSVGLGQRYPHLNFIGVDIKGARIWRGAKTVEEEGLTNVAFLRTRIDFITACFGAEEVSEIWLTFSDPMMKKRNEKRRLTARPFIERYLKILKPGGIVHLKTDSDFLYNYTLEQIEEYKYEVLHQTNDLYANLHLFDAEKQELLQIKTFYEQKFLATGKSINYCCFRP